LPDGRNAGYREAEEPEEPRRPVDRRTVDVDPVEPSPVDAEGSSMTLIRELIDIPERVHRDDFVLRLAEGVTNPAETLRTYVVTTIPPALAPRQHGSRRG